jgi:hypothetical protein
MINRNNVQVFVKPRDIDNITNVTGNLYKSVAILAKRANQISKMEKDELSNKLAEFAPKTDNLEEVFDNREQMEISAHYEKLAKASIVSIEEMLNNEIYFRSPEKDDEIPEE